MPGFEKREQVLSWEIGDASDLKQAIEAAENHVNAEDGDAYLSFVLMTQANTNVDFCKLMKITMTDDSVVYELELS